MSFNIIRDRSYAKHNSFILKNCQFMLNYYEIYASRVKSRAFRLICSLYQKTAKLTKKVLDMFFIR